MLLPPTKTEATQSLFISQVIDLLKNGAPSVLDAEGQTPLHLAAAAGHLSLVEALLQAGCDVSVQDFVSFFTENFITINYIDELRMWYC